MRRLLGVPWLFAVAYSAVGFSLYFSIGVVADFGLGLTPLLFLGAGLLFVLTTFTYVEAGAMFLERGGSSTFARNAFNELISFVAGWAVLIDYIIVVAIADEARDIEAAAIVMQLRYRDGTPLYGKALQTVLAERPCRVIVAAEPKGVAQVA